MTSSAVPLAVKLSLSASVILAELKSPISPVPEKLTTPPDTPRESFAVTSLPTTVSLVVELPKFNIPFAV